MPFQDSSSGRSFHLLLAVLTWLLPTRPRSEQLYRSAACRGFGLLEILLQKRIDSPVEIEPVFVLGEAVCLVTIQDPFVGLAVLVERFAELVAVLDRNAVVQATVGKKHRHVELVRVGQR